MKAKIQFTAWHGRGDDYPGQLIVYIGDKEGEYCVEMAENGLVRVDVRMVKGKPVVNLRPVRNFIKRLTTFVTRYGVFSQESFYKVMLPDVYKKSKKPKKQ